MNNLPINKDLVLKVLHTTNLNIDPALMEDVLMALKSPLPQLQTDHSLQIIILSISAIIAQNKRIPGILQGSMVSLGLPIEMFLRHVPAKDKHSLLDCIELMILNWKPTQTQSLTKVRKVKYCYQMFQSYCLLFQKLTLILGFTQQISKLQLKIFWIVYLTLKNRYTFNFILQDKIILEMVIKSAFQHMIGKIDSEIVDGQIRNYLQIDLIHSKEIREQYSTKISQILREIYEIRYSANHNINFIALSQDMFFLIRFLDDFSNIYEHWQYRNRDTIIDEILFLNLEKTLTPLTIRKPELNIGPITKKINFSDDEDEQDESESDHSKNQSNDDNDEDDRETACLRNSQPFQPSQMNTQNSKRKHSYFQSRLRNYCRNWTLFQKKLTNKCFLKTIRLFLKLPKGIKSKTIRKINKQIRSLQSPRQFFQLIVPCLKRYHGYDMTAIKALELNLHSIWN